MTDLSFINSCETITDAANVTDYEPEVLHSPVAFSAGAPRKSIIMLITQNNPKLKAEFNQSINLFILGVYHSTKIFEWFQ